MDDITPVDVLYAAKNLIHKVLQVVVGQRLRRDNNLSGTCGKVISNNIMPLDSHGRAGDEILERRGGLN